MNSILTSIILLLTFNLASSQLEINANLDVRAINEHAILADSKEYYGVFASGTTGVWAISQGKEGVGVYGHAGFGRYGIQGYSSGFAQTAVIGWSDSEAGNGLSGVATNTSGKGVFGRAQDKAEWGGFFWGGKGAYVEPRLGIYNHDPEYPIHAGVLGQGNGNGAHLTTGGSWVSGSSRSFKEAFNPVDPNEILSGVEKLPITRWQYKESTEGEHIGPMAEDFYAQFGLGENDKYIASTDADGIALAAIQALSAKVRELEKQVSALRKQHSVSITQYASPRREISKELKK